MAGQPMNAMFYDPQAMADMQADMLRLQQRQALAQSLMSQGYVPNSGKVGLLSGLAGLVRGKMIEGDNDSKISDLFKRQFELQNAAATAQRQRELEDEQRKFGRDMLGAQLKAGYEAKAKLDYAPKEWRDGGMFDPTAGAWVANPDYAKQQVGIRTAEADAAARAAAKYRDAPGAGDIAALKEKIAQAQAFGATPDQILALVLGQHGQGAPSGYRATKGGDLEPIPGGPADKPKDMDAKAAAAQQALSVLGDLEGKINSGSAWTGPVDQYLPGQGQQSFQSAVDALVNPFQTLTRVPGQGSQSDMELKQLMGQFPSLGKREDVNLEAINRLREYIARLQSQGPAAQGGEAQSAPSDQDLLMKYGGL